MSKPASSISTLFKELRCRKVFRHSKYVTFQMAEVARVI